MYIFSHTSSTYTCTVMLFLDKEIKISTDNQEFFVIVPFFVVFSDVLVVFQVLIYFGRMVSVTGAAYARLSPILHRVSSDDV